MKSKFFINKAIEANKEGLEISFQATDEDLPGCFWPDVEEKFWSELEDKVNEKYI